MNSHDLLRKLRECGEINRLISAVGDGLSLSVVPRRKLGRDAWDAVVRHSPDGWISGLWAWQEMIAEVVEWGTRDLGFGVVQAGALLAVVPLHLDIGGLSLSSPHFGASGPVVAGGLKPRHRQRVLAAAFTEIRRLAAEHRARRLAVAASPISPASIGNRWGINPFLNFGLREGSTQSRILDLRTTAPELWSGLSKDARHQVRKAQKAGYQVERRDWMEMADAYYATHLETYHRTGARPHPRAYFEGIARVMAPEGLCELWVGIDPEGIPVAFQNVAVFGGRRQYWTGCSRTDHQDSGINYLVMWSAIAGAAADGADWFEIGETFADDGAREGKKTGLTTFKSKFGGDDHRYFQAALDFPAPPPSIVQTAQMKNSAPPPPQEDWGLILGDGLRLVKRVAARILGRERLIRAHDRLTKAIRGPQLRRIRFIEPDWVAAERAALRGQTEPFRAGELEAVFRRTIGLAPMYAVAFASSGRTALEIGLRLLAKACPDRREVIIPSYACRGVFDPVIRAGLIPVFADIGDRLMITPETVAAAVSSSTLACVIVHPCGWRADMTEISAAVRKVGAFVVSDECQSLIPRFLRPANEPAADIEVHSFGIGKPIMATAGGAVSVAPGLAAHLSAVLLSEPTQTVAARARALDYHDGDLRRAGTGEIVFDTACQYGMAAISALDAHLTVSQLERLDTTLTRRDDLRRAYDQVLARFPGTYQPPRSSFAASYPVILRDGATANRFIDFMAARRVDIEWMYTPLHLREFGRTFATRPLPASEDIQGRAFMIPFRANLTDWQRRRICRTLARFGEESDGRN